MQWNFDFVEDLTQGTLDSLNAVFGGVGTVRFLTGTPPGSPSDAETGTLVAVMTLQDPPFSTTLVSQVAQMQSVSPELALASGTVTYARFMTNGGDCILQCTCDESSGDIIFDETTFTTGDVLVFSLFALTFSLEPT